MAIPTSYPNAAGIPLPSDETVRRVIGPDAGPETTLNVLRMFAGTEDLYAASMGMVKAVFAASGIDPRLREMIILRAAAVLNVPYEWQANARLAANAGLSAAEIAAAASDGPVTGIADDYMLVCAATDQLSRATMLEDATLQRLVDRFGPTGARKIVLMIGWFNLLSIFLNGCRVPLETTDKIGTRTTPLG